MFDQLISDDLIPESKAATLTLRLNSTDFRLSARKALSGPWVLNISWTALVIPYISKNRLLLLQIRVKSNWILYITKVQRYLRQRDTCDIYHNMLLYIGSAVSYLIFDNFWKIMLSFSTSFSSMFGILNTIEDDRNHVSLLQLSKKDVRVGDSIDICRNMSTAQCVSACQIQTSGNNSCILRVINIFRYLHHIDLFKFWNNVNEISPY